MVNQPLYGTVWDDICGNGHTSSRRGIVNSIGMSCNTHYGECIQISVGYNDGKEGVNKPDLRKIKKGERDAVKRKYEEEVDKKTQIFTSINITNDKHFIFDIDGVEITPKLIAVMKSKEFQDFLLIQDI